MISIVITALVIFLFCLIVGKRQRNKKAENLSKIFKPVESKEQLNEVLEDMAKDLEDPICKVVNEPAVANFNESTPSTFYYQLDYKCTSLPKEKKKPKKTSKKKSKKKPKKSK